MASVLQLSLQCEWIIIENWLLEFAWVELLDEKIQFVLQGELPTFILCDEEFSTLKEIGSHQIIDECPVHACVLKALQHLDDLISVHRLTEETLPVDVPTDYRLQQIDRLCLNLNALTM